MSTATRGELVSVSRRWGKLYQTVSKHKTKIKQKKKAHLGFFVLFSGPTSGPDTCAHPWGWPGNEKIKRAAGLAGLPAAESDGW